MLRVRLLIVTFPSIRVVREFCRTKKNKMQGRTYYITTLESWQREAPRFAASHYIHADPQAPATPQTKILAMIETDEGTHNTLSRDPRWQELPHALAGKPIPTAAVEALANHQVSPFATTFEATEAVAKNHPIMKYRPL